MTSDKFLSWYTGALMNHILSDSSAPSSCLQIHLLLMENYMDKISLSWRFVMKYYLPLLTPWARPHTWRRAGCLLTRGSRPRRVLSTTAVVAALWSGGDPGSSVTARTSMLTEPPGTTSTRGSSATAGSWPPSPACPTRRPSWRQSSLPGSPSTTTMPASSSSGCSPAILT